MNIRKLHNSMKRIFSSSGVLLGGGNLLGALIVLVRNIVVARLISVEDFGIAATFGIAFALIETMSNVSLNRLIVQAKDGNETGLQSALHSMQVARGFFGSILLLAIAVPYAWLMGVPDIVWGFQLLAITPIFRGFMNLDVFRMQRFMRFGPHVITQLASQSIAFVSIWPLYWVFGDYQVVLWSIIIQQGVSLVVSHLVAERPYRLSWNVGIFKRALLFGGPLLGNALLVFVIFNGDRLIIGNQLGVTVLGWFSVAFLLTLAPSQVFAQTLQSFFLPKLSAVQDDQSSFSRLACATTEAGLLVGVLLAVGFSICGPAIIIILFGEKYTSAMQILTLLAVMQAVRIAKVGPVIAAISKGETTNPLVANVVRILFLPASIVALEFGADVVDFVWIAIWGEVASFCVSLWLVRARLRVNLGRIKISLSFAFLIFFAVCLDNYYWPAGVSVFQNLHTTQIILLFMAAVFPFFLLELKTLVLDRVRSTNGEMRT